MLWTSDVVKDPWFPLVKDPSGSMSSYHQEVVQGTHLPIHSACTRSCLIGKSRDDFETVLWTSTLRG